MVGRARPASATIEELRRAHTTLYLGVFRLRLKRRIRLFLLVLVATILVVAWELWRASGAFVPVVWSTGDGGLILSYIPGKDPRGITLVAGDSYQRGAVKEWKVVDSGATERFLGAPSIPPIEELFSRATIPSGRSTALGLCKLYKDVGDRQRESIIAELRDMIRESAEVEAKVKELWQGGEYPWLGELFAE